MSIIYLITVLIMIILHILIYKKEEKQNLLKWIAITIVINLCYNIFICVILSFIKISSTLITLSIINTIISILLGIKIYKDKKIQKYEINKIDIIAVIIMLIIVILTVIKQYGIPINITHEITDGTIHYFVANEFYHTSQLLFNGNSDVLDMWHVDFFMPGAYINTGILFKIFSGFISETYFCQLFFIFDISIWFLSGILMYVFLSKNKKIIPLIFSIIYMIGYPLNSLLSGFSYLSLVLDIIIAILIVNREEINKYYKMILMFLLNFGMFFSYYFFAPVVYLAIFLQIIIEIKKNNEKIFSKDNIIKILYTLILPGTIGVLFFVVFQYLQFSTNPVTNSADLISTNGTIYMNFIGNIIIFLLLSIYFIIYCIKNRKNTLENLMLIINIIFTLILYVGMKTEKVSEYYYYKTYYLLWILVVSVGYYGIEQIIEKRKLIPYLCIAIYCSGIFISIISNKAFYIFDIFRENNRIIQEDNIIISYDEIKLLDYYNTNINTRQQDTYVTVTTGPRAIWLYVLTRNPYFYINLVFGDNVTQMEQFEQNYRKYFVLLKRDFEGDYENLNLENVKILFENEAGMVIEKN